MCTFRATQIKTRFAAGGGGDYPYTSRAVFSKRNFLTGTDIVASILAITRFNNLIPQQLKLSATNFSPINTCGYRPRLCGIILAVISILMLCAVFTCHYKLPVGMQHRSLIDSATYFRSSRISEHHSYCFLRRRFPSTYLRTSSKILQYVLFLALRVCTAFGLYNVAQSFQRFVYYILQNLNFCFV